MDGGHGAKSAFAHPTARPSNVGKIMIEKLDRSRRKIIRAIVAGASAGLLFRSLQTHAAERMTKQRAEYQDTPNGIYSCGLCTLFEKPKSCKVVEGEVSEDGWCKAFALAD
jgi:hypothetical protein